jgi:hypothetical protein
MESSLSKSSLASIKADAKSVREILDKNKYEIDVFQREYMWQRKQIEDLLVTCQGITLRMKERMYRSSRDIIWFLLL